MNKNRVIQKKQRSLHVDDGRFHYTVEGVSLGWEDVGFSLCLSHGTGKGGFEYDIHSGFERFVSTDSRVVNDGFEMRGAYSAPGLEEVVSLRLLDNGALRVDRIIQNTSEFSYVVQGARAGGAAGGKPVFTDNHIWRSRFCHMDNLRTEKYPWCRPEFPYVRSLPKVDTVYGCQESLALPAILLTNDSFRQVLLEGQLAQDKTRAQWTLSAGSGNLLDTYELNWSMHNGGFELFPGGSLSLEPMYYQILEKTHPQDCWDEYIHAVVDETALQGEGNILLSKAFYCSWNYGVFHNITEESLLKTARFIAGNMPSVKHFLVDGGWQGVDAVPAPSCANFYLPEHQWCDAKAFPNGMKGFADKLREQGLTPAIWWTPSVALHSTLAKEHPEWLAKDASGNVYRIGHSGYLDYSLAPVQEYLHKIFSILFKEWGYEAMKMDFWAQSVESEVIRFAAGTGTQWRDWLLSTIRSYLPEDGFLMTCVATSMGNPFLGKYAQTYRCSIDVGACDWQEHVTACIWNLPLHALPSRKTILPNMDGVGWGKLMSDEENMHRLVYVFITMGSIEVDGRLEEVPPDKIDLLNKILEHMDRGYEVRCPDKDAFTGTPLPKCLYVDYPEESLTRKRGVSKHMALFNWSDDSQCTGYTADALGLNGREAVSDFWSGEPVHCDEDGLMFWLPARSARLFEVST